jgi:two-component system sensor histidine kinase RegB
VTDAPRPPDPLGPDPLGPADPLGPDPLGLARRRDWVPLRTLTVLRWLAVAGQVAALVVATRVLGLDIPTGLASIVIGASVVVNLAAALTMPPTRRLSEKEAALLFTFDIVQLGLLLGLTGGLNNPFALLILAPVTIAATVLQPRSTLLLGALTLAVVTALGPWHLDLVAPHGPLEVPALLQWGFWAALVIGVGFLALTAGRVAAETAAMGDALAATRLALDRAQRLSDLDGVVAAAAHEMGTPLATIKLVTSEMIEELEARPDPTAASPTSSRTRGSCASRPTAAATSCAPWAGRPSATATSTARPPRRCCARRPSPTWTGARRSTSACRPVVQPDLPRRPEIVHGLRNLIQNAVDFAASRVELRLDWTADRLSVRIRDDGPGFPPQVLERIGDPFLRLRRPAPSPRPDAGADADRPGYEGMGLRPVHRQDAARAVRGAAELRQRRRRRRRGGGGLAAGPARPRAARGLRGAGPP